MSEQLGLFQTPKTDPKVSQLLRFLRNRDWLTRKQLEQALKWDHRTIRSVVEASEGQILSGQKGYKLTVQSTREEFEESCGQLRSQIKTNTTRLHNQQRIFHQGVPTTENELFKTPNAYSEGH